MHPVEQRGARIFPLRFPIEITPVGHVFAHGAGVTENISSEEVEFSSDSPFAVGEAIKFRIKTARCNDGASVVLCCTGRVVRTENRRPGVWAVTASIAAFEFARVRTKASES